MGQTKQTNRLYIQAITHPILEYANTICSPIITNTKIKKLQIIQDTPLHIATACQLQILHDEIRVFLIGTNLKLLASQLKQLTQTQIHPLWHFNAHSDPSRNISHNLHNNHHTNIIMSDSNITPENCLRKNLKHIHTTIIL